MGSGVPRGARPPSHIAYYVALAGIIGLLILLCFYFFYYFIRKVKELSSQDTPVQTPVTPRPQPIPSAYPVQPVVRDSATAMAKLCKQLPNQPGKGDIVFPTSTSPAAQQTDTGEGQDIRIPVPVTDKPDKIPVPITSVTVLETAAAR